VVDALGGVAPGMRFITGTGGETLPAGVDPKSVIVERSVPMAALQDAMLAWEMNGEPISLAHGGPLRLIIPGYTGVNNVKYIKRLAFTRDETDARIQASRYRMVPPGGKGNPSLPSVWEMGTKSWINSPAPGEKVRPGWVQIHGVAMGGMNAARRVDVSIDGGKTWREAAFFGPNLGRYAWRQFVLQAQLRPGTYQLASRATDTQGHTQEETTPFNASGYLNAGWRAHMVPVTVA
jgi:sulfite dehydrogenase